MAELQKVLRTVQAAVVDQRAHNIRYRQNELHRLHAMLLNRMSELCDAARIDSVMTQTEAEVQYGQLMAAVHESYVGLDNTVAHNEEYSLAQNRSHPQRKIPYGLVLIRPSLHARLYSVLQPLVAAIAAGNCVIVEVRMNRMPLLYISKTCTALQYISNTRSIAEEHHLLLLGF